MQYRFTAILVGVLLVSAAVGQTPAAGKSPARAKAESGTIEQRLEVYAARFLPFDPETRVTVQKASEKIPGFDAFRVQRKGHYEKLNVDKVVYVSTDGHWFFAGDVVPNPTPRPVSGTADLEWISTKFTNLFRLRVRAQLTPERDAAGWKGVAIACDTGYFPARMPGYVSPDGKFFLQGTFWDFQMDPRAERRRRIDLSANRVTGPADAAVQLVEYADLECAYCKFRGIQLDRLLEANTGVVNVRRHYKFFPLWLGHIWAMKAASAADCIFKYADGAMFRFKQQVYARQESLNLSGIDELAITTAEAEGISSADFLSCYLQEESFARVKKDLEEGYRLGVNSTPTYFIDGTEVAWLEDKVMEDFLRTLFPKIRTISYAK
jgi:protein-disulfide isomerase